MPESDRPPLDAESALLAYVVLLAGMYFIGAPAQSRGVVFGLWLTESVAIVLPAIFRIGLAGVRFAPYLGLRRLTWKQALIAAGIAAANQPVISFVTWLAHSVLPKVLVDAFDAKQVMLNSIFAANLGPMLATVVTAAPIAEELFFRGFALPAMARSWGPVAAVIVSGALFSGLHGDPVGFVGLMEIGILLAALRLWSGSLWAAVIGHAVNNGIAGMAFVLGWQDPAVPPHPVVLVLGALLLIVGIGVLARVLRSPARDALIDEQRVSPQYALAALLALLWLAAFFRGASQMLPQG
jgi:membrane protease YdiL (CAAX protease family)